MAEAVGLIVLATCGPASAGGRYDPAPVGPELLFDQTDQDCAGVAFVDSYASTLSFLTTSEPPVCYSYGTPPTPDFIAWGQAHLYWLDQVPGEGNLINGVDLKYWTTAAGPNTVRVHFRQGVNLLSGDAGAAIHPPETYVMTVPGNMHAGGQTSYFVRMMLPSDWEIAHGAVPGYFVGELIDAALPVSLDYDNIVAGTGVETDMPAWRTVASVPGDHFGVAMSLNEGWLDDGDLYDDPTMGWFLASHDYADVTPYFQCHVKLDHLEEQFIYCDTGSPFLYPCPAPPACDPDEPYPEASIYLRLWAGDCNYNGVPDQQDIAGGTSEDCNGNGLPDECEPGDIDGDGDVDLSDFATFALCYSGTAVTVPPPGCAPASFCSADIDDDNDVDLEDFATLALNFTG